MFISKKHIPRRTFLRGAGVTLALPLLESMVPALTPLRLTAAAPVKRFVGIWHPHGAAPGYWSPLQGRPGLRLLVHHEAARAVPQSHRPHHRPRHAGGDGHRRRAGRRSRARRGAAVGRAAAAQRREPVPRRDDRSDDRRQVRPGHDPVVAAARRRGHGQLRQLQLGLQLRVHELDLVVLADAAAADAGEPARRLRAAVRRRHEHRGAARGTQAERQHPRFGDARARRVQEGPRRRRPRAPRHLSRERQRARAANQDRDGQLGEGAERRRARSACRKASTSTSG